MALRARQNDCRAAESVGPTAGSKVLLRAGLGLALLALLACQSKGRLMRSEGDLPRKGQALLIAFEGAPALAPRVAERRITPSLDRFEESGFNKAFIDDATYELRQALIEMGYLSAEARASIEALDAGRRVRFELLPGPRTRLGEFSVTGIQGLPAVRNLPLPGPELFEPDGSGARLFSPLRLDAAIDSLQNDLFTRGYIQAKVQTPAYRVRGQVADVLIQIEAGPRHLIGKSSVAYRGPSPEGAPSAAELQAKVQSFSGRPDIPTEQLALRRALLDPLEEAGYPDVRLRVRPSAEQQAASVDQTIDQVFVLEPGERVKIVGYEIRGTGRTRESFVIRRLAPKIGQWFAPAPLTQSFRRLYRTGLFERVGIELSPGPGSERKLEVDLTEGPAREVFVEPGYGTFDGARMRAGLRDRNAFGQGLGLRLESLYSQRTQNVEAGITDPDFLGDEILGDLQIGVERRERPAFTRRGAKISGRISYPLSRALQLTSEYRFQQNRLSDVAIDAASDPELAKALESVDIASILVAPAYDTRDRLFTPESGVFARFGLEWASQLLGSSADFVRITTTGSWYFGLEEEQRSVLAFSARAGWIATVGSTQVVPLQERFFLGGATSVRAFREDRLGPTDNDGTPLGGESFQLLSLEWRRQLSGALDAGLFYDLGAVNSKGELPVAAGDWAGGPGIGLRYLLPVGPLRVDVGFNPDPGAFEPQWVFNLAVGLSF